ncbi:MAG TPA: hypothetical protein VGW79_01335, partial [Actinomycetota bacterium]|nr:hypothetical protein [Actinomycetota bacterium]
MTGDREPRERDDRNVPETSTPSTGVTENDIGGKEELLAAYEATIKAFDDGDLVQGKVVRVDK